MHKPGLFGMNGFMALFLTCLSVAARAQQPGFLILIEAENKQAFSIRIGDEVFASSGQGHLVISQLKDSNYNLCLRFPKNDLPEQVFPIVIHHKDLGFQLKGSDSSWQLYNWQNKEIIRSVTEHDSSRILSKGTRREDGFSRLMAAVVNDSSVMYNTYTGNGFKQDSSNAKSPGKAVDSTQLTVNSKIPAVIPPPPAKAISENKAGQPPIDNIVLSGPKEIKSGQSTQKQTVLPIAGKDKKTADDSLTASVNKPPAATLRSPTNISPSVKKLREVSLKISRKMVFQDIGKDGQIDTITLFVFFESADSIVKKPNTGIVAVENKSAGTLCSQAATDEDVSVLRSAILKANTEDDKIAVSSDAFAIKCFSVSQVRLLASLFVSDKAKYRLMDAAHQHITNPDHFHELVDMLTDKNFQRKFLVMADKRS